ncbi:hypothetical protein CF641_37260 [Burkholderia pseudomallei]|nr:hypothetical protein CF641_37260 [Burkholderia pseudomallei]
MECPGVGSRFVPVFTGGLTGAGTADSRTHRRRTAAGVGARAEGVGPERSAGAAEPGPGGADAGLIDEAARAPLRR